MFKDIQIQASGPDGWELLVPIVNNNSYQGHCNKGASLFQHNELFFLKQHFRTTSILGAFHSTESKGLRANALENI